MKNIDWIFFDLGGVIFDDSKYMEKNFEIAQKVLQNYSPNITLKEIKQIYYNKASAIIGNMHENVFKCFLNDKDLVIDALLKVGPVKKLLLPKGGYSIEFTQVRAESTKVLSELSRKYHLGVIANQHRDAIELLKLAGVEKYFYHFKVSDHHGFKKPDPQYFEAVLKETGADPKRSVMIDDNLVRGLMPAKKIGMTTVWFKGNDYQNDKDKTADFTVSNLSELLNIF